MIRKIRLGIDVGGTFTKAVAIDILTGELLGKMTVPTTHNADNGVAEGIVLALKNLMETYSIQKSEIELLSHSTTQAVNALLEGDTAKVGIIGMGVGLEKSNVVKRTNIKNIELSSNKYLHTCFRFLDTSKYLEKEEVEVVLAGSIYDAGELIIKPMRELVLEHCPRAKLIRLDGPPAVGAVILGMEQAGFDGYVVREHMVRTAKEIMK